MSEATRMVIDDLSKFDLLADDMKAQLIKGATATVNVKAALARKEAIKNIESQFITRNTFTKRQVQFTPMPEGNHALSAIQSTVGITTAAEYMARQEEGGEHRPKNGKSLAIPTDATRVGNSHRGMVQRKLYVSRLKRQKIRGKYKRTGTHKSRLVARAMVAFKTGNMIHVNGPNLFWVTSFKRKDGNVKFRTRQVYSFDKKSTPTKAQPWLIPACEKVEKDSQAIFNSQMKKLGM
jgi:hypothetical protein